MKEEGYPSMLGITKTRITFSYKTLQGVKKVISGFCSIEAPGQRK